MPRIQINLSTCVVIMIVSGVVVGLNFVPTVQTGPVKVHLRNAQFKKLLRFQKITVKWGFPFCVGVQTVTKNQDLELTPPEQKSFELMAKKNEIYHILAKEVAIYFDYIPFAPEFTSKTYVKYVRLNFVFNAVFLVSIILFILIFDRYVLGVKGMARDRC